MAVGRIFITRQIVLARCSVMTQSEKLTYRIQYIDNTFQVVDWTKEEFATVSQSMYSDDKVVILTDGIFRLSDIRTIVFLPKVVEEDLEQIEVNENELSEWGFADPEAVAWLREQGIGVKKGGAKE